MVWNLIVSFFLYFLPLFVCCLSFFIFFQLVRFIENAIKNCSSIASDFHRKKNNGSSKTEQKKEKKSNEKKSCPITNRP